MRVSVHRVEALVAEMGMRKDGLIYILEDGIFEPASGDLVWTSLIEVVGMDLRDVVLRDLFDFGPIQSDLRCSRLGQSGSNVRRS